jgi:hypothetical protein
MEITTTTLEKQEMHKMRRRREQYAKIKAHKGKGNTET